MHLQFIIQIQQEFLQAFSYLPYLDGFAQAKVINIIKMKFVLDLLRVYLHSLLFGFQTKLHDCTIAWNEIKHLSLKSINFDYTYNM